MTKHFSSVIVIALLASLLGSIHLHGEGAVIESYKKQERKLSQKRFKQKKWTGKQHSGLTQKAFPFKDWNMQYSSLGSKKWGDLADHVDERKRYDKQMIKYATRDVQISKWQDHLANLESKAQISTSMKSNISRDKRIYEMMLQKAKSHKDTGEILSLRDINRFQFRRNHSDKPLSATKAGISLENEDR